jgi:hypothetical protein
MEQEKTDNTTDKTDKIVLPPKLQREMMLFFLKASASKTAHTDKERQQTPPKSDGAGGR